MTTALRSITDNAHENGHAFNDKLAELRTLLAELATIAPAAAGETIDQLNTTAAATANNAARRVIKTVQENPAKTAAITIGVVGVGVLTWWLMTRGNKAE